MTEDETINACAGAQDKCDGDAAPEITAPVMPEPFEDIPEFLRRDIGENEWREDAGVMAMPHSGEHETVREPVLPPVPSCRRMYPLTENDIRVIAELTTGKEDKANALKVSREAKAKAKAAATEAKHLGQRWDARTNKWVSPPLAYARSLYDKPPENSK
jgi:hypothetical protein